ncbi:hypothetical protein FWD07_01970 [Candidatus Saccharibacteria bacterium]|nr:hypothetical protein [Candidatus Saccharibacteria bacterium]
MKAGRVGAVMLACLVLFGGVGVWGMVSLGQPVYAVGVTMEIPSAPAVAEEAQNCVYMQIADTLSIRDGRAMGNLGNLRIVGYDTERGTLLLRPVDGMIIAKTGGGTSVNIIHYDGIIEARFLRPEYWLMDGGLEVPLRSAYMRYESHQVPEDTEWFAQKMRDLIRTTTRSGDEETVTTAMRDGLRVILSYGFDDATGTLTIIHGIVVDPRDRYEVWIEENRDNPELPLWATVRAGEKSNFRYLEDALARWQAEQDN